MRRKSQLRRKPPATKINIMVRQQEKEILLGTAQSIQFLERPSHIQDGQYRNKYE